jgi:hypothetical protein
VFACANDDQIGVRFHIAASATVGTSSQSRRQERERHREVAQALEVRADRRRHEVGPDADGEVDPEEAAQHAGLRHAARDDEAEAAEDQRGRQLQQAVREAAPAAEQAVEDELRADARADGDHLHARVREAAAREDDPREDDDEEREAERARRDCQCGAQREPAAAVLLQSPQGKQRERDRERERERGRAHDPDPEHGERPRRRTRHRAPLPEHDDAEGERRRRDRREREHADPEHRGERVVQDAVGDERVAARVPEVVPDRETVLEQERALVGVRRPVDPGRGRPQQEGGECRGESRRDHRLAREQPALGQRHRVYPTRSTLTES